MQTSQQRWPIGTKGALWLASLLIVGHYLAMFGAGGALTVALGVHDRREIWAATPAAFIINIGVGLFEIGFVLRLWMGRYARLSFRDAGWRDWLARRDVVLGVLGFAVFEIVVVCVFASDLGVAGAIAHMTDEIAHYTPQQHVFFTMFAVIAVIPEEIIFRGVLQPTLQNLLGRWSGIVLTALIFSLYHVQFAFTPTLLVSHMCHGLILGLLRERTGTLWAPGIAHGLAWVINGSL